MSGRSATLAYLLKQEWSMGNGQCPECCGVPPSWHSPHGGHRTCKTIGHVPDCVLAAALTEAGGQPLMLGDYKSDVVYEDMVSTRGFMGLQIKGSDPEARERSVQHGKKVQTAFMEGFARDFIVPTPTKGGNG